MSQAMWNDAVSPYDMLGVDASASSADVRLAFYQMSKLYHPDRNQGLEGADARTAHFVKCKRAYDILRDPSLRKIYDGCLLQREKLARRSMFSTAVSNTPEFRDVVDEQFKEAVFDPEMDIRADALVLCCESCGAPSKFRCNVCDMLTCAFCALKPHASDVVPPHYPIQYSRSFRRKMEASDRQKRLRHAQETRAKALRPLRKTNEKKKNEKRLYRRARSRVKDDEIAGQETRHAELTKCYAWLQSETEVLFAIWVPFDLEKCGLSFAAGSTKSTREFKILRRDDIIEEELELKDRPVVDGRLFYEEVDRLAALECAIFAGNQVVVGKLNKKVPKKRWPCLFEGDSDGLRDAGDHDRHDWRLEYDYCPDDDLSTHVYVVDLTLPRGISVDDIDVEVSAKSLTVNVEGWPRWTRHFIYATKTDEVTWTLNDSDGRVFVSMAFTFGNMSTQKTQSKTEIRVPLTSLFVEDDDDLHTLAFTQVAAFLHYKDLFLPKTDLLDTAQDILKALEFSRPRHQQHKPVPSLFSTTLPGQETIKLWFNRSLLQDEIQYRQAKSKKEPLLFTTLKKKKKVSIASLPPEKIGTLEKVDSILHLFDDARGLERQDIASFAWDDASPVVKVYISLAGLVDSLTIADVAVRFQPQSIAVHVKNHQNTLLCFQRHLFHTIIPKKSTLKINKTKKSIALSLQKQREDLIWSSLARNVNVIDTTPAEED